MEPIFKNIFGSIRKKMLIAVIILGTMIAVVILLHKRGEGPIRIGAILSLSGPAFYVGQEERDGLLLAMDEINAWGGVNGRKLELIIEDSKSDPETGKRAFKKLESEYNPLFYISTTSSVSMALAPLAEENQSVLVGLVVTNQSFPGQREWVFRYYPTAYNDVPPIIPILRKLKINKLGILHVNDQFGNSIFEVLQREFTNVGGEVYDAPFASNTKDFTQYFEKLKTQDAIYIVGFVSHLKTIFGYLDRHPLKKPLFSNNAATIPSIRELPMADGVYVSAPLIYKTSFRLASEVKEKYESRFNKPFNHYAANGYDLIKLMAGLLEGQVISRENVKLLLEKGFIFPGVFGEINVKPGDHCMSFPLHPAQIVEGNLRYLSADMPIHLHPTRIVNGENNYLR